MFRSVWVTSMVLTAPAQLLSRRRGRGGIVVLLALALCIAGGGVYVYTQYNERSPALAKTNVSSSPLMTASALGRIQPFDGIIALGVSLPDQLAKVLVKEGQDVDEGAVLAELQSHADRQLELDLLDWQIKEAGQKLKEIDQTGALQAALDKLELKKLQEQGPLDVNMQKLKVDYLKKQAAQARAGLARISPLPSVSKQEKDQQEMAVLQSQAELAGAEDLLQKLTLGSALNLQLLQAKTALAQATLERTRREVPLTSLRRQRDIAALRVAQTFIKAPRSGKVLRVLAQRGELVGAPQPILQMADLSQMAVLAEVYETDISKIFDGQTAFITSKVDNARKLTGKVKAISNMIGKNRVYDADPLADVDRRVIEVKILVDQTAVAAKLINLQVNVDFQPR